MSCAQHVSNDIKQKPDVADTLYVEQVDRVVLVAMNCNNFWRRSLYSIGGSTPLTEGCINRQ